MISPGMAADRRRAKNGVWSGRCGLPPGSVVTFDPKIPGEGQHG